MDLSPTTIGIVLAILFVAFVVYRIILGPTGIIRRAQEAEARQLEVRLKIGGGIEIIDTFLDLARAYLKIGKLNEAEQTMRQALTIAENELGKENPDLIPIIKTYASVLGTMNRKVEAQNMLKRAKELKRKKR